MLRVSAGAPVVFSEVFCGFLLSLGASFELVPWLLPS